MDWSRIARDTIGAVHASLPSDADLPTRTKAVDEAYPFGEREMWPYKAWLKARRSYLMLYGYSPKGMVAAEPLPLLSPLERAKARALLAQAEQEVAQ